LFFVSGQKTTALFCLHSVWMTGKGQGHHGRRVCSSEDVDFVLLTGVAVINCLR
jgi:hypothetical protein